MVFLFEVVIIRTIDSFRALNSFFMFDHCKIDHFYDVVSLQREGGEVAHRLQVVLELDDELVILKPFDHFLNHGNVVRVALMIFESVVQHVLHKIEL